MSDAANKQGSLQIRAGGDATELQMTLLELLVVCLEGLPESLLIKAVGELGLRGQNGRKVTDGACRRTLKQLAKAGLVAQKGRWFATPSAKHQAEVLRGLKADARKLRKYQPLVEELDPPNWRESDYSRAREAGSNGAFGARRLLFAALRGDVETVERLVKTRDGDVSFEHWEGLRDMGSELDRAIRRLMVLEWSAAALVTLEQTQVVKELLRLKNDPEAIAQLAAHRVLQGRQAKALELTVDSKKWDALAWRGVALASDGRLDEAALTFELARETKRRVARGSARDKVFLDGLPGLFDLVILAARARNGQTRDLFATLAKRAETSVTLRSSINALRAGVDNVSNDRRRLVRLEYELERAQPLDRTPDMRDLVALLSLGLVARWTERPRLLELSPLSIEEALAASEGAGLDGMTAQLRAIYVWLYPTAARKTKTRGDSIYPLVTIFEPLPAWRRKLNDLRVLATASQASRAGASGKASVPRGEQRVIWVLEPVFRGPGLPDLTPFIQKLGARNWSKGRRMALEQLAEQAERLEYLTPEDRAVLGTLKPATVYPNTWSRVGTNVRVPSEETWLALAGHPRVFWDDDRERPIRVEKGVPTLHVHRTTDGGAHVQLEALPTEGSMGFSRPGPGRVRFVHFGPSHMQLADILTEDGLTTPPGHTNQVGQLISSLAGDIDVVSELDAAGGTQTQAIEADPTPILQLTPAGTEGLAVRMVVRPLGQHGPTLEPGVGAPTIMAEVAGVATHTTRDLPAEKARAKALRISCPALTDGDSDDLQGALELLLELSELRAEADESGQPPPVHLEWPDGHAWTVTSPRSASAMNVTVTPARQWFELSGHLTFDEGEAVAVAELLRRLDTSAGRFVKLDDGRFIALTNELRRRLASLGRFAQTGRSKAADAPLRIHKLAASAVESLLQGAQMDSSEAWREQLARMAAARAGVGVAARPVPSTLKAELRGYQTAGFHWMTRLAAVGAGACLADDMGLGKTVQALALMIDRAPDGPQLVVAPTSVGPNWEAEMRRFAPTLRGVRLGTPGTRKATVAGLGPFDVLITSHAMLHREGELLGSRKWRTAVIDEAQAIKNPDSKRAKGAYALKTDFRLALTGTPIENRLGELWSLFRFINPGLLGTRSGFRATWAGPIEVIGSEQVATDLRQLIRPFVLRRTKSAVLTELPPRTDIVLPVELGEQESATYEALRRVAIESMERSHERQGQARTAFQILPHLIKLRLACCNAGLVTPELEVPSAKQAAFEELVGSLVGAGHKVLVFSQFVKHLTLIRAAVEKMGLAYQYLDGGTPAAARAKRVTAFQAGEGDLFLISLKAGGTGLNLTAADYVIHMDPWWNPAVEDQASDRAHRIGQERPVVVYRLIAKGTIEERILALNERKRELATDLLAGTDLAGRLSPEELMELLAV